MIEYNTHLTVIRTVYNPSPTHIMTSTPALPLPSPLLQMRNDLKLPDHITTPSLHPGRVLIISNQDTHNIHIGEYDMIIPPSSTIILLYDGERWVDIQALKVASTVRYSTLLTCSEHISYVFHV